MAPPEPTAPARGARSARRRVAERWRRLGAALALACCLAAALAQPPDAVAPTRAVDLPIDDVRAGDVGYALTEGPDGTRRMEVVVLAIQEPAGPGFATLLIRVSGTFVDEAGGVAAGMSGSPVYLGPEGRERLAGALAYAFPDSDHRLALVTPIAAMRALADGDRRPVDPPGDAAPLATPLLLSGIGPRAAAHLTAPLERAGHAVVEVQAGAGGTDAEPPPSGAVEPGDAVAIALARGDVGIAAVGTVTDVRGDEVLLLGHPFLRGGPSDHALLSADVTAIVPSRELPFKLANVASDPSGRVVRDGQAGVVARLGSASDDVPLTLRIVGPGASRTVTARLTRDRDLTPALVAAVVQASIDDVRDRVGGGSADLAWEISFRGEDPIRMLEQRVVDDDLATSVARLAAAPIAILLDNPFRDPDLARISVRIGVEERPRDAEIVEVALETPEVAPGGTVQAFVRVQPFRGEAEVRTLAIGVPRGTEPGPLELTFRGASVPDPDAEEREPAPIDPLRQAISGLPPILSWGELLAALEQRPQARELLVEIPGASRATRLAREDLGRVVTGLERVTVRVVDPDDAEAEGAPSEDAGPDEAAGDHAAGDDAEGEGAARDDPPGNGRADER